MYGRKAQEKYFHSCSLTNPMFSPRPEQILKVFSAFSAQKKKKVKSALFVYYNELEHKRNASQPTLFLFGLPFPECNLC